MPDVLPDLLYVATSNPGKLRDFRVAATESRIRFEPLPNLAAIPAPDETETTFEGNARLKALYYSRFAPNQIVIADDSGLEVDALHGEPGVRSARFAADAGFDDGSGATTDARNNLHLLHRLRGFPPEQRNARYRCVLAAARDGKVLCTAEGYVKGAILEPPRGQGGFGYDPLFYLPELGMTMAEITLEQKHILSHRGRALHKLLFLLNNPSSGDRNISSYDSHP